MTNSNGEHISRDFIDCREWQINIRYKSDSNNDPRRIPARVTGKDHANNYRERSGIDNMLDIHVLKYGRNEQIKDDIQREKRR